MKTTLWNVLVGVAVTLAAVAACATTPRAEGPCAQAPELDTTVLRVRDPGPRGGSQSAGGPFPTLNANEQATFTQARDRFQEVDSVSGVLTGEPGVGLGPTFNGDSCAMCHAQPAIG